MVVTMVMAAACGEKKTGVVPHGTVNDSESDDIVTLAIRYKNDAGFRRKILEDSLVNPSNRYAQIRFANYERNKWTQLPEACFLARPVVRADVGATVPTAPQKTGDAWESMEASSYEISEKNLLRRGEELFTRYPAQLAPSMVKALESAGAVSRYGLWQTDGSVGGLVWMVLPGGVYPAVTCSSCHASVDARGEYRPGRPNHLIDSGKVKDDFYGRRTLYSTWGPGKVDVAGDGENNPVVIADVRTVRFQTHLHRTANVKNSLEALAVRIETGLIMAHRQSIRPTSLDAFALAFYLWSLGDAVKSLPPASHPGRSVFERHCGNCHQGTGLSGQPVPTERLNSPVAEHPSSVRGTGYLNCVSLRGVSDRGRLLFGGEATGIDAMFDPQRKAGGHFFGNRLSESALRDLKAYLNAL